jgi:hypothetical protein
MQSDRAHEGRAKIETPPHVAQDEDSSYLVETHRCAKPPGRPCVALGQEGLGAPLTFTTKVHEVKAGVNYHWPSATPTGQF